ncbi:abnormal spindle-like microcephaly-associated protein [Biomphalaria glabrata]
MQVTDPVSLSPIMQVTDPVSLSPVMQVTDPVTDPVGLSPVMQVTDPVSLSPVMQVTDPVSLSPSVMQVTDPVGLSPVMQVTDPVGLSPVMQVTDPVTDPISLSPVMQVTDPVSLSPVMQVTDPVCLSPVMQVTDPVSLSPVMQVTDPEELQKAAQLQREAAAAVDIQRIFRGYVARTAYKCLLPEERWKREDDQKAALEIQRMNKEHNQRMNAIYSRPPLSPDIKQWSNDVRSIQLEKALQRQDKMDQLANEMIINQKESKNKLSSIGPHVEIYDIYHPKQVGPTMKEYHQAAIKIQKIVRGWMVRRKIEKLARKATWYGSNFSKMAREYKFMLKQVQSQHGVDKPKSQFSIKDFNNYIDIRRRYEIVFEKKAFSGELEVAELKSFFTECGLHPSQTEIDEALDVTTHGQAYKTENKGLKKRELLDLLFYIYVPPATGLQGTRKSTWMNPIINGEEGRKLFGSEFVEPAPLEPCAKLVIQAKREQRQKEQAIKEAEERKRIEESLQRTEEKKQAKKSKQALIQDPSV